MESEPYNATATNEISRLQLLKAIKNKFYIHKSFDFQSDLEFLPSLPIEASKQNQMINNHLDMLHSSMRNDYYTANNFDYGQKINIGISTPKTRSTPMNNSPKRNGGLPPNSRRKVSQNNSNIHTQSMRQMGNGHGQHLNSYNNIGNRNW